MTGKVNIHGLSIYLNNVSVYGHRFQTTDVYRRSRYGRQLKLADFVAQLKEFRDRFPMREPNRFLRYSARHLTKYNAHIQPNCPITMN